MRHTFRFSSVPVLLSCWTAAAAVTVAGVPGGAAAAPRPAIPSSASVQADGRGTENAAWIASTSSSAIEVRTASRRAGGRWTRPATLATQPSTGGRPGVWGLRTDATGTATVFWTQATPQGAADRLFLARRPTGGTWSRPEVAPTDLGPGLRLNAADTNVGITEDGTTTAVWCALAVGAAGPSGAPAGAGLLSRTRSAVGVWGPPERVFPDESEYCNSPRLAVGPTGDLAVTWWGARFQGFSYRPPRGTWAAPTPVPAAGRPVFGPDGRIHVLGGVADVPTYSVFSGAGRLLGSTTMPAPPAADTLGGRRGVGALSGMTIGFTKTRRPVLIWNRQGSRSAVHRQTPKAAVWTATQVGARWVVRPVDPLGGADGEGGFDLTSDARGALQATWYGESRGGRCRLTTPVYRARLGAGGRWATRHLVGYVRPVAGVDCAPQVAWTPELGGMVQPFATPRAASRPTVVVARRSVAAVVAARGLRFTCATPRAGHCTVGITGISPKTAWSLLDSRCLATNTRVPTRGGGRAAIARLALRPTCRRQLRAAARGGRLTLSVLATTDVVGHRSGSRRLKIRLR